jgi:uncharacterized protein (DUF983 family)
MGYYQCIRCGGRDTYESEETTSYTAMTIDTPGPIDHTLVNANKRKMQRCRACGERAQYIMTNAEAAKEKKAVITAVVSVVAFVVLMILTIPIWITWIL